ncbi:MAG: 3'-5' exonuclease [Pyrinomonadaceae bacterium]|nr:3'-5' exonuclease [Pyrinomonadaceae bacterium]
MCGRSEVIEQPKEIKQGDEEQGPRPRGAFFMAPAQASYTPTLHRDEINSRALVIDTETTGRGATAEIIEVAVCTLDGELIFESLVRPMSSVPRAAARIHGLTTESLTSAPIWDEVWRRLEPMVSARTLIAYNAPFDARMLDVMCAGYRLPRPVVRWRCAMRFVKEHFGLRRAPTLTEACQRFGIEPGTHRAASDARATAALLQRILKSSPKG